MENFEKLLMLIWGLWTNRNTKLWEDTSGSATDIMFKCFSWLDEFQKSRITTSASILPTVQTWKPASSAEFKLNFDGAFVPQMTKWGLGGLLRTSSGQVAAAFQSVSLYVAVNDIHSYSSLHTGYGSLIEDIHRTLNSSQQVQICYAPCTCNMIAHRLASLAFESEQCRFWYNSTPDCIRDLIQKETPTPT
ncbi:uncharacterized protein LOC133726836 [Rosa rugosa]|uniref:uncharacterized protein LOC133726836 n=1 Tax=Rosa rugosa TaxID=74645 RepID=UPI002B417F88|nr:uncharacterized protein LOC133726836 [Rosa rugosa]